MMTMSEPGWYPDPQDDSQERFWNGTEWTEQVKAEEDAAERPVLVPSPHRRHNNAVLWGVLVLVLCLLVGSGWWLSTNVNQSSSTPEPSPLDPTSSATVGSVSSTTSVSSSEANPASSTVPTAQVPLGDGRPRSPEQISADPTSIKNPANLKVDDPISVSQDCPQNAEDPISEIGSDGRLTSQAGFSIPAINGFTLTSDPGSFEKHIYQSNNIIKKYPEIPTVWSTVTLGTLKAEEGFTEVSSSAKRVISCVLPQPPEAPRPTRIIDVRYIPEADAMWLSIEIDLPPARVPGVKKNQVSVFTCLHNGVMHVALLDLLDVTVHDTETYDAIWNAFKDMRLPS